MKKGANIVFIVLGILLILFLIFGILVSMNYGSWNGIYLFSALIIATIFLTVKAAKGSVIAMVLFFVILLAALILAIIPRL